jgi:chitinase
VTASHVNFDGSASRDDGAVTAYDWDFGDGSTGTGATTSHDYAPGTYTAALTVTDDEDNTCTATSMVTVGGPFSVDDVSVTESAGTATFTVSRAGGGAATVDVSATAGSASTPGDFTLAPTTLSFASGETSKTVDVAIVQDTLDENNEIYTVALSNASAGGIADGSGRGTIVDDDPSAQISVNDVNVIEPDKGTRYLRFTVRLNSVSGRTVTVRAVTADGSAQAPSDYASKSVKLTFSPGQLTKTVSVAVRGDWRREPNETMFLLLAWPTNATLADPSGTGVIVNDD